jgi:hypothetical protein
MTEVNYGVVQRNGVWIIIGAGLRFGAYGSRFSAVRAARRLAKQSSGLPVNLHIQDETGELMPPEHLDAPAP